MGSAGTVARRWLPNQHGAWAMLAVPFLAGVFLSRPVWLHLPLLASWLLGYLAVYHAEQYLRLNRISRNPRAPRRHIRPMLTLGASLAVVGIPLVVARPPLLAAGAVAAPFLAVNVYHAWRNRERALANGLAAVVPACGMLLVARWLGEGRGGSFLDAGGWRPALACLLYFAGTVPYVKTMIRERGSAAYRLGSVGYHCLALVAATLLAPLLAVPFALYLLRAALLPGRNVKVAVVGAIEVVGSVLLLAFLLIAF